MWLWNETTVQKYTMIFVSKKVYTYSAASSPIIIRILFSYQMVTLWYIWYVKNTYLHSLEYGIVNHIVIVKWNNSKNMYYDICT